MRKIFDKQLALAWHPAAQALLPLPVDRAQALVIDCSTRQLLGWHLSRTGRASTASRKTEARSHQGGYCSNCGKPTNLANSDAHHVQRHADGGATKPENMAVVCKDCHMDLHGADK